eukprot:TRINITY_DN4307_c0_g1_i12.p1 TRINITY_DN4307_c0_g1~~TRINITY_DN4307_c0_g1_i12.p1  ORF type:complete len:278 (+),score=32.61 TRINITY_DN4307_c0_g1_i12:87-920(+)
MLEYPPLSITADQLATKRTRFWFRWDTLLLNLLVPFTTKLNQHQLEHGEDPVTPAQLKKFLEETAVSFLVVTAKETAQVAAACALLEKGSDDMKCIAYHFDMAPRLKAAYYARFLTAARVPILIRILGYYPSVQAPQEDIDYDERNGGHRAAITVQRVLIPTVMNLVSSTVSCVSSYCSDVSTKTTKQQKRTKLFISLATNSIVLVGSLVAQVTGAVVGEAIQGPACAFILSEAANGQFLTRMPSIVQNRLEARFAPPCETSHLNKGNVTNASIEAE